MKTNFKPIIIVAVIALAVILFALPQMNVAALSESAINANAPVDATEATTEIAANEEVEVKPTENIEASTEAAETIDETQPETETEPETAPAETKPVETKPEVTEPKEETKPAHTHEYEAYVVAATCTDGGYTTHTCSCGKSYTDSETKAIGHDYEAVVTAPAIGAVGYTTYTCKICGDEYVDDYTDALIPETEPEETEPAPTEHVHNYEATVFAPNCTTEGCTMYVCECGDSYTDDVTPKTEHAYITYVVDPTYEEEGYDLHICEGCGDTYTDNYVPVLEQPVEEGDDEIVEDDGFIHKECHCDRDDGHLHEEIRRGDYTYIYCEHVTAPHKSPDGFKVWYPYDWFF